MPSTRHELGTFFSLQENLLYAALYVMFYSVCTIQLSYTSVLKLFQIVNVGRSLYEQVCD